MAMAKWRLAMAMAASTRRNISEIIEAAKMAKISIMSKAINKMAKAAKAGWRISWRRRRNNVKISAQWQTESVAAAACVEIMAASKIMAVAVAKAWR